LPIFGQGAPASIERPDRLAALSAAHHFLAQEDGARKVEHLGVDASVVSAAPKAIGLDAQDIEPLPRPATVDLVQELHVAHVASAAFEVGGHAPADNHGMGVALSDGCAGGAEQGHITGGVDGAAAPVRRDIGLIPYLVGADPLAEAPHHCANEIGIILGVSGGSIGLVGFPGLARP